MRFGIGINTDQTLQEQTPPFVELCDGGRGDNYGGLSHGPISAWLGGVFGPRRVLTMSVVVFGISNSLLPLSPNLGYVSADVVRTIGHPSREKESPGGGVPQGDQP
jgi:hypothetical protein